MQGVSSHTVANQFLKLAKSQHRTITNMKLQKLVYIAHGYMLGLDNEPLYDDETYAWTFGPVIKPLYNSLRKYGCDAVTSPLDKPKGTLTVRALSIIGGVWDAYSDMSERRLSNLTHMTGTPWAFTWRIDEFSEISNNQIRDYYKAIIKKKESNTCEKYLR